MKLEDFDGTMNLFDATVAESLAGVEQFQGVVPSQEQVLVGEGQLMVGNQLMVAEGDQLMVGAGQLVMEEGVQELVEEPQVEESAASYIKGEDDQSEGADILQAESEATEEDTASVSTSVAGGKEVTRVAYIWSTNLFVS